MNTLIENINRQRKLMGLNEAEQAQIKLAIVPADDNAHLNNESEDDEFDRDEYFKSKHKLPREYSSEPGETLDDKMDAQYPDPNERDWHMNRYSGIEEGPMDFVRSVASGVKNFPNKMRYDKAKRQWDKQTSGIKNNIDVIKNTLDDTVQKLNMANQQFNVVKRLGSHMVSFAPVDKLNQDLNATVTTLNDAIAKAEATLTGDGTANQQANTTNANQAVNGLVNQINQNANDPQMLNNILQNLAQMAQGNTNNNALESKIQSLEQRVQALLNRRGNNAATTNNSQSNDTEANQVINQMAADRGMTNTPTPAPAAAPSSQSAQRPGYTATTSNQTNDDDDDYYTQHHVDPNDRGTTSMSEKKK